jgi:hypothetical protein
VDKALEAETNGLWGRAYNQRMECAEVQLLTPARERTAANAGRERTLAGLRLTIESVFAKCGRPARESKGAFDKSENVYKRLLLSSNEHFLIH